MIAIKKDNESLKYIIKAIDFDLGIITLKDGGSIFKDDINEYYIIDNNVYSEPKNIITPNWSWAIPFYSIWKIIHTFAKKDGRNNVIDFGDKFFLQFLTFLGTPITILLIIQYFYFLHI